LYVIQLYGRYYYFIVFMIFIAILRKKTVFQF